MKRPPLGWCRPTEVKRVIDGDTVVIDFLGYEVTVRLQDGEAGFFDAPETRKPASEDERRRGHEAKEYLEKLLASDDVCCWIEYEGDRLQDHFCIGARLNACLFVGDQDVAAAMKLAGFEKHKE